MLFIFGFYIEIVNIDILLIFIYKINYQGCNLFCTPDLVFNLLNINVMSKKENYIICFVVFICSFIATIFIGWFLWSNDTDILIENISETKRFVIAIISLIAFGFNLCLFVISFFIIWNEKFLIEE